MQHDNGGQGWPDFDQPRSWRQQVRDTALHMAIGAAMGGGSMLAIWWLAGCA